MPADMRLIASDPDVFEEFYRAHVEDVLRFVSRRVGNAVVAADVTADIFIAAIDSAASYRADRGTPVAWLFGVARHVVAEERRRAARRLAGTERLEGRRLLEGDDIARIEERLDAAAGARRVYVAMDRLTESERAVLELVALDGLSAQDAARVLGIRPATARVRLHRARRRVQRQLAPDALADRSPATPLASNLIQEETP